MPYARRPVCPDSFHLKVVIPLEEWERTHVTERASNGTPLLKCVRCWPDLRAGHRVSIRAVPPGFAGVLTVGQEGGVVASLSSGGVRVRFGTIDTEMRWEDLFYIVGQPPVA
jgi:hypothetical protein